eukprot:gene748-926_t
MSTEKQLLHELTTAEYPYGFESNIAVEQAPKGLNEATIHFISEKKKEPQWLLEWRLKAYRHWLTLKEPTWPNVKYPPINYQEISYYAAPKNNKKLNSLDEIDPELKTTLDRLGISIEEQKRLTGVAMDIVIDSVSVATTFRDTLEQLGIIFCSFTEAVQQHPDIVQKYLGTVVPMTDNYFAALNSAVFSDGSFCYIPKGVRCPMELSTYFRINAMNTGQFERTLIIAEENAYVSYLEGCTAPMRDEHQLHAAVVEIHAESHAEVKYSTVQNWYPGDKTGKGGVYNFVTKRGICSGEYAKISWTQVETGSAVTWKYPGCILKGDHSIGEFYSIAVTKNRQQADTGTKMIHIGKNTKSRIVSKGISAGQSQNSYRGLVKVTKNATHSRNFSQCDSLLLGNQCGAHTFPYIDVKNSTAHIEHEATTSKIGEEQLFYCNQRGIDNEQAVALIVNGYCKEVLNKLPMEFAVEAQKLLALTGLSRYNAYFIDISCLIGAGLLLLLFIVPMQVFGGEIGIFLPGISYHMGANASHPAYTEAPRGLDDHGAFVLNPGLGIVYDWRNKQDQRSFSWSVMAMIFQDCDDRAVYTTGGGGRYRYHFTGQLSLDADFYLSLYIAQEWSSSCYAASLMPFPSIGLNYHLKKMSFGLKSTFAPKNESHSSTAKELSGLRGCLREGINLRAGHKMSFCYFLDALLFADHLKGNKSIAADADHSIEQSKWARLISKNRPYLHALPKGFFNAINPMQMVILLRLTKSFYVAV